MHYPVSTSSGEIGFILNTILDNVLEYKTDGIFVEVGANDGKTGSFTYNLAKLGWYGVNIEPIPSLYKQCIQNHSNHKHVINIHCAVGDKEEITTIYDAGTLSTIDKETFQNYQKGDSFKNMCNEKNTLQTHVRLLDHVLEEQHIHNIDLFVLDVEGYEEKVLSGFTIENYKPKIIIIEISDQHPEFTNNSVLMKRFSRLRTYFNEKKYTLLVNDIVDNVYVRNDIYENLDLNFKNNVKKKIKFSQYSYNQPMISKNRIKFLLLNNGIHYKNLNAIEQYKCLDCTVLQTDGETTVLKELENDYGFSVEDYDVIYSPSIAFEDVAKYKHKRFIFGPHFSIFPNENQMKQITFPHCAYIQPSAWACNSWIKEQCCKNVQMKIMPFGVDCNKYKQTVPIQERKKIMIYFKSRRQEELAFVTNYLTLNNMEYSIFYHGIEYEELDFLKFLQKAKFGIWIGSHESQGFALEETLASNVPLFVWNVTSMNQEQNERKYENIPATSIPYWDPRCGEVITNVNDFVQIFQVFLNKLYMYEPRQYILESVSMDMCNARFNEFLTRFILS